MNPSDDDIVITGSRNLNEETNVLDTLEPLSVTPEVVASSMKTLEEEGVEILTNNEIPAKDEPLDQFSKELLDDEGIEVMQAEDDSDLQ